MRRSVQSIVSTLTLTTLIIIITLLLSTHVQLTSATITLANKGTQYHSRPASFGFNLEYGLQYVALLQVVEDDLHLCGGINDVSDNTNGPGEEEDQDEFGGIHDWADNDHGIQHRRGLRSLSLPKFVSLGGGVVDIGIGGEGDSGDDGDDNDLEKKFHDALSKNSTAEEAGNKQKKKIHVVPSHGVPGTCISYPLLSSFHHFNYSHTFNFIPLLISFKSILLPSLNTIPQLQSLPSEDSAPTKPRQRLHKNSQLPRVPYVSL